MYPLKKISKKFLVYLLCMLFGQVALHAQIKKSRQRVIVIMMDGFGDEYYRNSNMPTLNKMAKQGIYKVVQSLMPAVTMVNNAAIVTGQTPDVNGITGNVFLNPSTGAEEYMEDSSLLLGNTIFERAQQEGVKSILLSCKTKTVLLLKNGAGETMSRETVTPKWTDRIGNPPDIYSREINYWIMDAALYSLKHNPEIGLTYIHTTDYPMHTWAPESVESKEHLQKIDEYLNKLIQAAPDAAILITADHTVTHKNRCWDLEKTMITCGFPIQAAISPEKDRYFKHHLGFGGSAYVYLKDQKDSLKVKHTIEGLVGVTEVLSKKDAAARFHLMPERIGDYMVLGDSVTVFGHLEKLESEELPSTYRSHGSLYDAKVPLFIYNAKNAPSQAYFTSNYKLASWLYETPSKKVKFVSVNPSVTGEGIETVHGDHLALYNPVKPDKHKLIFMITGTGTTPNYARKMDSCYAEMGYKIISIDYQNQINSIACKNSIDSTMFDRFRQEMVTGKPVSEIINVNQKNSILNRFQKFLEYLSANDPEGKWSEYLINGQPDWKNIIVAGHSQGSGIAAYISKLYAVNRVLLFSGPQDFSGLYNRPAPWLSIKGKTHPSRYFSFLNQHDSYQVNNQIANNMKLMQLDKEDTLHIEPGKPVNGKQHILITDMMPTDGVTAHSSVLNPIYLPVWEYMLSADVK